MLRLRQLTIRKYRDCEPCELKFGPGQVFLLGMNGGGKTTLVELLSRLASLDLGFFENDTADIDLDWSMTSELHGVPFVVTTWSLRSTHRHLSQDYPLFPSVSAPSATRDWKISARIRAFVLSTALDTDTPKFDSWVASGDSDGVITVATSETATEAAQTKKSRLAGPSQILGAVMQLLAVTVGNVPDRPNLALAALTHNFIGPAVPRLDEALVKFEAIIGQASPKITLLKSDPADLGMSFPVRVPLEVFRLTVGADAPTPPQLRSFAHYGIQSPGSDPPFSLRTELASLLGGAVEIVPVLESEDADGSRTYSSFTFYVTWPDGSKQRHDALSFGQKRMIAALWHIACTPDRPVFTDELSNGLHAAWITRLLELLGDQQAFHATQNPLLLDLAGPGPAEKVASRFVRCEVALVEGKRRWRWRNPTAEEAARINAGYEADFQHLSDILQSEGLW
ncbi:MAG: AAA family ATPase [Deltaproteobacteria bacterium]|nr:AAA family ATPase [Deltaproteobacteria bacterium]